ncbi:Probable membrane protein Cj0124c [hydrothermal vent metagenome]|uniref:Probable membrane protein Cj0124c n=1 Tax=hydrothermal vent metagenome TaxID=652676 RepID=A0A1W1C0P4_9ZZZZ
MYIKRYTIAALILMASLGAFVYTYVTQETTSIDLFGIPLPALSIAIWIVVPVFVLYVASVLHMSFYSLLGSMSLRKYEKDYDKIIDAIVEAYLGKKSRSHTFKTDRYVLLGKLLENTTMFPVGNVVGLTSNEKVDGVLKIIGDIKNGDVVDLKPYNLLKDNELVVQNKRNQYKKGILTAESILSNSSKYADVLREEAYVDYVKTASISNLLKYKALLSKESLYIILARVNANEFALELKNEELLSLINSLDLSVADYIKLSAVIASGGMIPEQRIKLFEMLSDEKEDAIDSYLYTLFDLEMLAPVDSILDNSSDKEYQNFKAYRALKSCNKNFSIEIFV